MSTQSAGYHEPLELLSDTTRLMHQALVSLQEELEAVDWYRQRADACKDDELRQIFLHNMREEIEHACMVLEWLRRSSPEFAESMQTYLFTHGSITEIEETETHQNTSHSSANQGQQFTVGNLKENP